MLLLLLIATLFPLLSFAILVFVGKRMGNPLAGIVATFFISASFVCSLAAMIVWLSLDVAEGKAYGFGGQPILRTFDWISTGNWLGNHAALQIGVYVDSLTVVMFSMITLVAALVHVFSLGYMNEDEGFPRYFTCLSLFSFSMLALVLGGTLIQLFVFWELVGLCSYLLIGFWYEKKTASTAAIKAFVTNRVGDVGFIVGLGLLFAHLGNVTIPDVWNVLNHAGNAQSGQVLVLPAKGVDPAVSGTLQPALPQFTRFPHVSTTMLTLIGVALFMGAMGKSAQFPLHVWLPDAMEGPTPVSALIHAATMVAAGVYLVARIFPILTPDAKLFIAIIGCITLTIGALIAMAQTDIKRLLAYSTLSQLGLMMLAMGVGSWVGGLFHLVTHAFFKALLFMGAGSIIHAANHEQELTEYGGLWRKIPYTAFTFGIAVLSIAGVGLTVGDTLVGFAGFYSKDLILEHAGAFAWLASHAGGHRGYWLFFLLPAIVAYLTPFYMTRCWMLTFAGKPRNPKLYGHARETPLMYIPLALLAILSIIGGTELGARPMIESAMKETNNYFDPRLRSPATVTNGELIPRTTHFTGFATAWQNAGAYVPDSPTPGPEVEAFHHGARALRYASFAFILSIPLAVLIYSRGLAIPLAILKFPLFRWIQIWLYRDMYFDELFNTLFVTVTLVASTIVRLFDRYIIDALVNAFASLTRRLAGLARLNDDRVFDGAVSGTANAALELGAAVRASQTGQIRNYVTALVVALAVVLAGTVVLLLSTTRH